MSWLSFSKPKEGVAVVRPHEDGQPPAPEHPELVNPIWLLKAGVVVVLAAAICGYIALCLIFYQGQWQLVLHPGPMQTVPAGALPPHQDIQFAMTETGKPTLYGWWIPADLSAEHGDDTLVYVPGGTGSISERIDRMNHLHQLRINVFAFDYRGYGNSAKLHPNQNSLNEDAVSAVRYLTETRHIPPSHIVLLGEGLGSLPALHAANQTPGIAAVIFENPRMSQISVFQSDPRTALLPLRFLIRDEFSLAEELRQPLPAQKLIFVSVHTEQTSNDAREVYNAASNPKTLQDSAAEYGSGKFSLTVGVFLEQTFPPKTAIPAAPENGSTPIPPPGK